MSPRPSSDSDNLRQLLKLSIPPIIKVIAYERANGAVWL